MIEKVVIIGGGSAGLSAAIYLARAGLSPLVFAGSPPGGQLTLTSEVENFPSQESILGAELIDKMRRQAEKFGAKILDHNITQVDLNGSEKKVYLNKMAESLASHSSLPGEESLNAALIQKPSSSKNFISTKALIIATGAKALWLNVPGEERLRGKGVSACATCDGFFFKDKTAAVVGGGDTAMEEALTLSKFAKKVYIIHRRDSFRASKIMQERVFSNPKIEVIWNAVVDEVLGEKRVESIKIRKLETRTSKQKNTDSFKTLTINGLFVAIGHRPDTEIFKNQLALDEHGYIITSQRLAMELVKLKTDNLANEEDKLRWERMINQFDFNYQMVTSVKGVFAAGDCIDTYYRQAATAAGMGVAAALEVERYLERIISQ